MTGPRHISECIGEWLDIYQELTHVRTPDDPATVIERHTEEKTA